MAAQINAQLEVNVPTAFSFESVRIDELQRRWLDHHEQILRSSVHTVRRYRTATRHLLEFVAVQCPALQTAQITAQHAEQFVRYLRSLRVSPNGHPNSQKRPLLDNGVRYILETCRSLFAFTVCVRGQTATPLSLCRESVFVARSGPDASRRCSTDRHLVE